MEYYPRSLLYSLSIIINEPQEFPLEQLWYHDAVLFLSPAALILKGVSIPNY
jgi:hypothetical protein